MVQISGIHSSFNVDKYYFQFSSSSGVPRNELTENKKLSILVSIGLFEKQ